MKYLLQVLPLRHPSRTKVRSSARIEPYLYLDREIRIDPHIFHSKDRTVNWVRSVGARLIQATTLSVDCASFAVTKEALIGGLQ